MSAFLGQIHYWLYNKVLLQERILEDILQKAAAKGYAMDTLVTGIYEKYGAPDYSPLEEVIDHGNIHGWLQERIHSVEGRTAAMITRMNQQKALPFETILDAYKNSGSKAAQEYTEISTPQGVYTEIYNHLLEGMPCDHVNQPVLSTETEFTWKTTQCLHRTFWEEEGGSVEVFYMLQDAWITAFVEALQGEFGYIHERDGRKSVIRREL